MGPKTSLRSEVVLAEKMDEKMDTFWTLFHDIFMNFVIFTHFGHFSTFSSYRVRGCQDPRGHRRVQHEENGKIRDIS